MQIDPTDNEFEPTKRYLIVIPGTGYFHVDSFEELVIDLEPDYPPDHLSLSSSAEADKDKDKEEAAIQREEILIDLADRFIEVLAVQLTLAGAEATESFPIEVLNGVDFQPYTPDRPIPFPTPPLEVVSAGRLQWFEEQMAAGLLFAGRRYQFILPPDDPTAFFKMLSLAGLVQITDLQASPSRLTLKPEPTN